MDQVSEINRELEAIESGASAEVSPATPSGRAVPAPRSARPAAPGMTRKPGKAGRTVRGELKERITSELKSVGKEGVRVKDLAARLGVSYANITSFFQSTGKKIKEIKKVGRGQFAWMGA